MEKNKTYIYILIMKSLKQYLFENLEHLEHIKQHLSEDESFKRVVLTYPPEIFLVLYHWDDKQKQIKFFNDNKIKIEFAVDLIKNIKNYPQLADIIKKIDEKFITIDTVDDILKDVYNNFWSIGIIKYDKFENPVGKEYYKLNDAIVPIINKYK